MIKKQFIVETEEPNRHAQNYATKITAQLIENLIRNTVEVPVKVRVELKEEVVTADGYYTKCIRNG